MSPDYTTVTELPETLVLPIQVERAYHRYKFGATLCQGRELLEVACGGGQGLGLLACSAKRVVGGDIEPANLVHARKTYSGRKNIEIRELDAQNLPFEPRSFDAVVLYEAIYYLQSPERFIQECRRILRPGGVLILCTANKDWPDFNPSPFSYRYFSIPELAGLLEGFRTDFFGAFPDHEDGWKSNLRSLIKRTAVKCHLMPRTMKGKVLLKRLFMGGLTRLPRELTDGLAPYVPPVRLPTNKPDYVHTAIYAVGVLP